MTRVEHLMMDTIVKNVHVRGKVSHVEVCCAIRSFVTFLMHELVVHKLESPAAAGYERKLRADSV